MKYKTILKKVAKEYNTTPKKVGGYQRNWIKFNI